MGEERMDNEGFLPGYTIPRVEPVVDNKEKRPRLRPVDRRQMILHPIGSSSAHSTLRFTMRTSIREKATRELPPSIPASL